jgi:hypothetical protein
MENALGVKYEDGWDLSMFTYKNYGFTTTKAQRFTAQSQFYWLIQNVK